jgi:hypothetical protein
VVDDGAGNREFSSFKVDSATHVTRQAVIRNAAGGTSPAVFTGSALTVYSDVPGSMLSGMSVDSDVLFTTSVPLTQVGTAYMPRTKVSSGMTFAAAAGAVRGALVYMRLLGDGANTPSFSGMLQWGGSQDFDTRTNIENQVQIFCDGTSVFYSISQAINAQAIGLPATALNMVGPSSGVVSQASSAFTISVNGALTSTVVATPSDGGAGGTFSPTSLNLTAASPTATFTYAPASTGAKTISIANNGGLTNPSNLAYTVAAAATAPGAPTIGAASAGDASATIAFTAPASNGGASIIDYTATASPGGATGTSTSSPVTVSGLTNGTAYTFTVTARNNVGPGVASAASNSVTPFQAQYPRVSGAGYTESGTGPYSYVPNSLQSPYREMTSGNMVMTSDGYFIFRPEAFERFAVGMHTGATPPVGDSFTSPSAIAYAVWSGTGNYVPSTNGANNTATNTVGMKNGSDPSTADWIRYSRSGTTLVIDVSKNQGASWTPVYTWTGVSGALYPCIGSGVNFTLLGSAGLS